MNLGLRAGFDRAAFLKQLADEITAGFDMTLL
jgi:hypothetical protein